MQSADLDTFVMGPLFAHIWRRNGGVGIYMIAKATEMARRWNGCPFVRWGLRALLAVAVVFLLFSADLGNLIQRGMCGALWRLIEMLTDANGMKSVITAAGAVGFALTYINTVREKRVRGVLIEKLIQKRYPCYGHIFVLYWCFAALGQYACAVDARGAGAICLLGMLLSLVYTLEMSLSVVFMKSRCEKLVGEYIRTAAKDGLGDMEKQPLIHHVSRYVAERFLENDLPDHDSAGGKTGKIGNFGPRKTPGKKNSPQEQSRAPRDEIIGQLLNLVEMEPAAQTPQGGFLERFQEIFRGDGEQAEAVRTDYILYSIPSYESSWQRARKSILQFGQMWQSMLSEIGDTYLQAELAYQVLREAGESKRTAALCCGLLRYLHVTRIPSTTVEPAEEGWTLCVGFLSQIRRLSKMEEEDVREAIQLQCRDMEATFLCLALFEQANSKKRILDRAFREAIADELGQCDGSDSGIYWGDGAICKYLCYAKVLFSTLVMPTLDMPSRLDMLRIVPKITLTVRTWLN